MSGKNVMGITLVVYPVGMTEIKNNVANNLKQILKSLLVTAIWILVISFENPLKLWTSN